jgi:Kef-type K+ transport system membrane component KefB
MLHLEGASAAALGYHIVVNVGFIALASTAGPRLMTLLEIRRRVGSALVPVALLAICGLGLWLGVPLVYGAFVAGIAVGGDPEERSALDSIRSVGFMFFVPVYFASVGASLDLVRHFEPTLFFFFLVGACAIKASSVYLGARLAGETRAAAGNIAVAMNARGGPGIVLASVAYEAEVIAETFYVVLVLLAIVTSLLAGAWLDLVVRRRWALS